MTHFTAEFSEVWLFVERKLKMSIPMYIKSVLKYCGYENCHTIATIEEKDFEYFTTEVRKGGIVSFFSNEIGTENALQGTNTCEENFEFSRGHQKLLLRIVKLVKENLNENGVDAFSVKISKPKKMKNLNIATTVDESPYEVKDKFTSTMESEHTGKGSIDSFHEDVITLQATLLKQTIRSLFIYTSDMYEEVRTQNNIRNE